MLYVNLSKAIHGMVIFVARVPIINRRIVPAVACNDLRSIRCVHIAIQSRSFFYHSLCSSPLQPRTALSHEAHRLKEKSRIRMCGCIQPTATNASGRCTGKMFSYDKSWLMPNNDRKNEISNEFNLRTFFVQLEKYQYMRSQNHMKNQMDKT